MAADLKPDVLNVATPEPFSVPVPRVVEPSRNVTVPVGVPEPGALAVTVAVNVTDWPNTEGLAEDTTADARRILIDRLALRLTRCSVVKSCHRRRRR